MVSRDFAFLRDASQEPLRDLAVLKQALEVFDSDVNRCKSVRVQQILETEQQNVTFTVPSP